MVLNVFFWFTVLRSLIYAETLVTSMQNRKQASPNTPKNFLELTVSLFSYANMWQLLVYSLCLSSCFSQDITGMELVIVQFFVA